MEALTLFDSHQIWLAKYILVPVEHIYLQKPPYKYVFIKNRTGFGAFDFAKFADDDIRALMTYIPTLRFEDCDVGLCLVLNNKRDLLIFQGIDADDAHQ